jgi:UDP-GlcNAc3NAcA epimerase
VIHTGQHYDHRMSEAFFAQLRIPRPDRHLDVRSGSHGRMTGRMLEALERVLVEERPALVLVVGDTNSTLAGALAAVKLGLPVAHVEAGLRSFDPAMPEEINRKLTDHVSALLFCPTPAAVRNLAAEGLRKGVHRVGDVMKDALAQKPRGVRPAADAVTGLAPRSYYLATLHRQENVDDPVRLRRLLRSLEALPHPAILPLHPRTEARLRALGIRPGGAVRVVPAQPYVEMIALLSAARAVLTDSGGVQKEAHMLGTPCITLRETTEWVETLAGGANRLAGSDPRRIAAAVKAIERRRPRWSAARLYGDGHAGERIAGIVERFVAARTRAAASLNPADAARRRPRARR